MKALIDTENKVIDVKEVPFDVHPNFKWIDCPEDCKWGWIYQDGQLIPPAQNQLSEQEILNEFNQAIQDYLNYKAKEKQYESALHCASYASSTNQQWQQEAQTFVAWRDDVWLYAYSELALIQSGDKPIPTIEEFIQGLPELNW